MPPHKLIGQQHGAPSYRWFISEDEYLRLSKPFGRDFQEILGLAGTRSIVLQFPAMIAESMALWFPGHAIMLKEGNQTSFWPE